MARSFTRAMDQGREGGERVLYLYMRQEGRSIGLLAKFGMPISYKIKKTWIPFSERTRLASAPRFTRLWHWRSRSFGRLWAYAISV